MDWIKKGGLAATIGLTAAVGVAQFDPEYGLDTVHVDQLRSDWQAWTGLDQVEDDTPDKTDLTDRLAFELDDLNFVRPVAASAVFQKAWEYNKDRTRIWMVLTRPDAETGVRRIGVRALRVADKGRHASRAAGEAYESACPDTHAKAAACFQVEWLSRRCEDCRGWGLLAIYQDEHSGLRVAGQGLGVLPPYFARRVFVPRAERSASTDLASLFGKLLVPTRVNLDDDKEADAWRVEMHVGGRLVADGEDATAKPLMREFLAEHDALDDVEPQRVHDSVAVRPSADLERVSIPDYWLDRDAVGLTR